VRLGSPMLLEEVGEGGLLPGLEGLLAPAPQTQRQQDRRTGGLGLICDSHALTMAQAPLWMRQAMMVT
jgi:hypothetical protein